MRSVSVSVSDVQTQNLRHGKGVGLARDADAK